MPRSLRRGVSRLPLEKVTLNFRKDATALRHGPLRSLLKGRNPIRLHALTHLRAVSGRIL